MSSIKQTFSDPSLSAVVRSARRATPAGAGASTVLAAGWAVGIVLHRVGVF
jgi:hypothetical protein